jgi:hypothetical protein
MKGATVLRLFSRLFGCKHRKHSFPFTDKDGLSGSYVVCFECGKHLSYDWSSMRITQERVAS